MLKQLFTQKKEKLLRLVVGFILVGLISWLHLTSKEPIISWITTLENIGLDYQVRKIHKPLGKDVPITIVDLDDKSLAAEGRWPWPREKLASLIDSLYKQGALVVSFDITFPDPDPTGDPFLAKSLQEGDSILGMVFKDEAETAGVLPSPLLELTPEQEKQLQIPDKHGYLANVAILQKAAKAEGFINASPDPDGVLRFTPLLFRVGNQVYGSLALQAAMYYLLTEKIELVTSNYAGKQVLEGIKLDSLFIPTDAQGRIFIPYRGLPYTFPYISAVDIINQSAKLSGKLVILGSTASALGDIRAASIAPIFPGVEVHASVISGIIDNYLPYKPTWGRGVTLALILVFGSLCALLFPFLGVFVMTLLALLFPTIMILGENWLWQTQGIVLTVLLPILLIALLYIMNIVWGYLFESKRSKNLKSMFGQYVPPAYLDQMIKAGKEFSLDGESKELSVLFSDIRDFTSVSEKMSAKELKTFINEYLSPITEVIFNHQGTIDKYVGDMVMAFWGAPLDDPQHAFHAVQTGIAMQKKLKELNTIFAAHGKPQIKIGVGINSGIMNVGDMGSKFRRSYTVLGDSVNLASRLEGQTKFYHIEILVGENCYQLTKNDFAYLKIDKIRVKGKKTAVEIYTPLCQIQELDPKKKARCEKHDTAINLYLTQQWDAAEKIFQQLIQDDSLTEPLYAVYIERIKTMRKKPPGPEWDGAYTSHEK